LSNRVFFAGWRRSVKRDAQIKQAHKIVDSHRVEKGAAMSHLAPEQLYAAVFDHSPLPAEAVQHLAQCEPCRRAQAELQALAQELAVSRAAAVAPAALDHYAGFFSQIQQSPARLNALWRSVTALLTWDSRQQPALQGVRSAAAAGYRLLYAGAGAEVELLVEGEGSLFRVQGEIMPPDGEELSPALVQWFDHTGNLQYEAEAGADGQFALRGVQAGGYRLTILTASGDSIEIEALEIA
jgi:hypothetical protein